MGNGARMSALHFADKYERADENNCMYRLRRDVSSCLAEMRRPRRDLRQTPCNSIMNSAFSGFEKPLDHPVGAGRDRRPSRLFKKPRATADYHFLFGPGADVVERNRPPRLRLTRRASFRSVRGRRELPIAWRAPRRS